MDSAGRSKAPASVLVVAAHPDDADAGCGGTLAGWTTAGARATIAVLTDGALGSHDTSLGADDLRARRRVEQEKAAATLGVHEVLFMDRPDGFLQRGDPEVVQTAALIRELRPSLVIGHDPWLAYELHPDHRAAGRIVCDAVIRAREPRLDVGGAPAWRPDELWLFWPEEPNHYENIADTLKVKAVALSCHHSQYASSFGLDPDDPSSASKLSEMVTTWARDAAPQSPHTYVEAFHRTRV